MILKISPIVKEKSILEAFTGLQGTSSVLRIFTRNGNLSLINSHLIRFTSPLIKNILKDVPCYTSHVIFIPDVFKNAVDSVIRIISKGFSDFNRVSIKDIKEVQIDLYNLDYVEKSAVDHCPTVNDIPVGVAIKKELPDFDDSQETVNQGKREYSNSSEYVEQNDSLANTNVKEDPIDQFWTNGVESKKFHPNIKTPLDEKENIANSNSKIFPLLSRQSLSLPLPLTPQPEPHPTSRNKELRKLAKIDVLTEVNIRVAISLLTPPSEARRGYTKS